MSFGVFARSSVMPQWFAMPSLSHCFSMRYGGILKKAARMASSMQTSSAC